MLKLLSAALAVLTLTLHAQTEQPPAVASLTRSLEGDWVGVLEYRDYSEPAGSLKRVTLPTWLSIAPAHGAMTWTYTYDDGPNKVLKEEDTVAVDAVARTYSERTGEKPATVYSVDGLDQLKDGRGVLVLHGTGTDDGKPSETRITMTVRRNLLEVLDEVRPDHSTAAFAFRHVYRMTRAAVPAVTAEKK